MAMTALGRLLTLPRLGAWAALAVLVAVWPRPAEAQLLGQRAQNSPGTWYAGGELLLAGFDDAQNVSDAALAKFCSAELDRAEDDLTGTSGNPTIQQLSCTQKRSDAGGVGLRAGLRINTYFALEASYLTLGSQEREYGPSFRITRSEQAPQEAVSTDHVRELDHKQSVALSMLFTLPLSGSWSAFARLGFHDWTVDVAEGDRQRFTLENNEEGRLSIGSERGAFDEFSVDGQDMLYGIGAELRMPELNLGATAEILRYDMSDSNDNAQSVDISAYAVLLGMQWYLR